MSIRPDSFVNLNMESETVRACLQKPGFAQRLLSHVSEDIFTNEIHRWIISQVKFLTIQNRGKLTHVPVDVLKHLASRIEDKDKQTLYTQAIDNLYKKPVEYEDYSAQYMRDNASYQYLTSGIREALSQYKQPSDIKRFIRTIEESARKSSAILSDVEIYDYASNWKERESVRKFAQEVSVNNIIVRMGIPKIDEQIKLIPGTVTGFVAPFKRYKSVFLNHVGMSALLQGLNVFHVTLENTVEMTADRYDAMFSNLETKKVLGGNRSAAEQERIEQVLGRLAGWPQRLKIFAGVAQKTSFMDVATEIENLEMNEGFSPEVVIFDYANIAAPSVEMKNTEDHRIQGQIVWDAQFLAKKMRTPHIVVTAFQSKSEGIKAERLDSSMIGKSIGIAQALDQCISIDQNENEKALGIVTLSPLFIRNGPITHSHVTLDSDMSRMAVDKGAIELLWQQVMEWDH